MVAVSKLINQRVKEIKQEIKSDWIQPVHKLRPQPSR